MKQKRPTDKELIVEKKLGIPPDYQYRALRSKNFLQANWHKNKLLALQNLLPFSSQTQVLDLGTGSGNFELAFARRVKQIVGVDYNDEALNFLKRQLQKNKIGNVKLILADIRDLSPLNQFSQFNYIISVDVIEHIKANEAHKVIESISKLLRPEGKVCIITPNYQSAWILLESLLDRLALVPKFRGQQHSVKYFRQNLSQLFAAHGFALETFRTFNAVSYLFPWRTLAAVICRLELALPLSFGNMIAAVFVKSALRNKTNPKPQNKTSATAEITKLT